MNIHSFGEAMHLVAGHKKRHLLLGNGFSISLKPDIFSYGSLFENADFSAAPYLKNLFEALNTKDFEAVIRQLFAAATVIELYQPGLRELSRQLRRDAEIVKSALVTAIAHRHPNRPYDVTSAQYVACRAFTRQFDHLFTLNYDVLLYWTLMQDQLGDEPIHHDDGFRHPDDNAAPYVSWQQADSASVSYLHGALHLFDRATEITKYTWSKTDLAIVDQVRDALDHNRFPIFVAEGSSASKQDRILHNAYLHKALRSFEGCMNSPTNALVIFGHSLAENDMHVLRYIAAGKVSSLLVGIYGDQNSPANQEAIANALHLVDLRADLRGPRVPLEVHFYNAASAHVWG